MDDRFRHTGTVLLIVIFVVALSAAVVAGMLQLNTEEIMLVHNHISAVKALAVAEAGLNDAFSELRADSGWNSGFVAKSFNGGSYTVTVDANLPTLTVLSTGTSSTGFIARVEADVTVSSGSPYILRIDHLRINE
jgi:hypothetical protein